MPLPFGQRVCAVPFMCVRGIRPPCMGASRGFRNRADESDWSNIDVLRELRLRGAIRDVYSCMHSWARKSLVLCFAFGHLGVLFVSVASGISRRAYLIDVPRFTAISLPFLCGGR